MRILSNIAVSGNLNLGSTNKKDIFVIGTPDLENNNVNTDVFTVWANADFKNNVQLGTNADDLILISGSLTASNGFIDNLSVGTISSSLLYSADSLFLADTFQAGYIDAIFLTSSVISSSNLYTDEFLFASNTLQSGFLEVIGESILNELVIKNKLTIQTGSNKPIGVAILNGANNPSVTVINSLVNNNSLIFLTKQTNNHNSSGLLSITKNSGSFTIYSNHNGDTDQVGYLIVNN